MDTNSSSNSQIVQYINMLTWLWGFQDKLLYLMLFSLCSSLYWESRDKRNLIFFTILTQKPRSHVAILRYWTWPIGIEILTLFLKETQHAAYNECRPFKWPARNEFWSVPLTLGAQSYNNNNKTYHTRFWINMVCRGPCGKHVWWVKVRKGLNIEKMSHMIFMQKQAHQ